MAEESWHAARLIPTSGISGAEEQERRATSALLAVMGSVREFGRAIVGPLGAPTSPLETFIEVPFELDGQRVIPDGLIRARRGQRSWTALVEVKTSANTLNAGQLDQYLDVAKLHGFDALLTISNEIPSTPGGHPTAVDKRKLRKVALHHLSWTHVLTQAVMQKVHRGISDPDQAWILGELIRYLEHPRSGAMDFSDMGASWVEVRNAVVAGTLRAGDKSAIEVVGRWDQLLSYLSLRLGRELGIEVQPVFARAEQAEPGVRTANLVGALVQNGVLRGSIRIPDTVAAVDLTADLRAGQIIASVAVEAPREGRAVTRVNWLVRQLRSAPETVRVDAFAAHSRGTSSSDLLRNVRVDPTALVPAAGKELRSFMIAMAASMGPKRGRGRGTFIDSVVELLDKFYGEVVQTLKPWSAKPPRLREKPELGASEAPQDQLVSTALSSQDGPVTTQATPVEAAHSDAS